MLCSTRIGTGVVLTQSGTERRVANGPLSPYKARVLLMSLLSSGRAQAEVVPL